MKNVKSIILKGVSKIIVAALVVGMLSSCNGNKTVTTDGDQQGQKTVAGDAADDNKKEDKKDAEKADKKYVIGYSAQNLTNTYFVEIAQGMQDHAKELGIDVNIHDGKSDAASQITAFENWITQGVDAIICSPVDAVALEPLVKRAQDAGIVVVAANQDIGGRDAFVTVPEYEYGYTIGEYTGHWIVDNLGGKAKVLVLDYPEIEAIIARGDGIVEGMQKVAPDAEVVSRQSANSNDKGMQAMESALVANPDINVVVGVNDAGVLGAYEAMKATNPENVDKIFFAGLDAAPEALDAIKEGGLYKATVDIQPYESGKLFIDTAINTIEGTLKEEVIEIPMKVVDSSNISDY